MPKRGRPRRREPVARTNIVLPAAHMATIVDLARREDRSDAAMLRRLLRRGVDLYAVDGEGGRVMLATSRAATSDVAAALEE